MSPYKYMCVDKPKDNYAFIDGTNLYLSARALGWDIDWKLFRQYLQKRHNVTIAYYFIGYLPEYQCIYDDLTKYGYQLIFKEALRLQDRTIKGNCDAEMVLHAMIEIDNYAKAVIVTGDGDIACLVKHLSRADVDKFKLVIACRVDSCSSLIRKAAGGNIMYLDSIRDRIRKI